MPARIPEIYTIGVYGSTEQEFFQKLKDNGIETFCDIRQRRSVRGSEYSFANSNRLQEKLSQLSIQYIYEQGLAPTATIRGIQSKSDKENKIQTRKREQLDDAFQKAYKREVLGRFDLQGFIGELAASGAKKVVLFCLEKSPAACHRSLVSGRIQQLFPTTTVTHL